MKRKLVVTAVALLATSVQAQLYERVYSVPAGYTEEQGKVTVASNPGQLWASTITATFGWNPGPYNEDPPQSVVLTQRCTSSYQGVGLGGLCKNGLGDPPVKITTPLPPPAPFAAIQEQSGFDSVWPNSGTMPNYHDEVRPGAATIVVTCKPELRSPPAGGLGRIIYEATLEPVRVVIHGVVYDTEGTIRPNILVGQKLGANVWVGPEFTLANHQWQALDKGFYRVDWGAEGVNPMFSPRTYRLSHVIQANPGVAFWQQPSIYWFFDEGGEGTGVPTDIHCNVEIRRGTKVIGPATALRKVAVWTPYRFYGHNLSNNVGLTTLDGHLYLSSNMSFPTAVAMNFVGRITVPNMFQPIGVWSFNQTITLRRQSSFLPVITPERVLDNTYPYASEIVGGVAQAAWWPVPNPPDSENLNRSTNDTPAQPLGGNSAVTVDDDYYMHQIFVPPPNGLGTEAVSLAYKHWRWQAGASPVGSGWAMDYGSVTLSGEHPREPKHHQWIAVYLNTGGVVN